MDLVPDRANPCDFLTGYVIMICKWDFVFQKWKNHEIEKNMKIFTDLTFFRLISHQLLWLREKNWFQWCFLKKMQYQKFTSFFGNFHQIRVSDCSEPPQTWKNARKRLKKSVSSGHRFYLGCYKIWASCIEHTFLADDRISLVISLSAGVKVHLQTKYWQNYQNK